MDKVKIAVAQLKKHHFWVLCALIVVTALAVWDLATADVETGTTARVGELEGKNNAVGAVVATRDPPNERVIQAIHDLINGTGKDGGLKKKVVDAWTFLYDKQTEKNPLPKVLDRTFVKDFQQLEKGQIKELPEIDLEQYFYKIQSYVCPAATDTKDKQRVHQDYLFERVDLRRPKNAAAGTPAPRGERRFLGHGGLRFPGGVHQPAEGERVEMIGVLEWDDTDLDRIQKQFVWDQTPDTLTVQLAQEDLWVYEALLRIIENTNKGTTYENAAIKRVEALEIGKQAARSWGQAEEPVIRGLKAGDATGRSTSPFGLRDRSKGGSSHGLMPGGIGHRRGEEQESPLADRYVDEAGNPLEEAKRPHAEFNIFNMMPINLRLVIHQKKITKLLAECANSNMPIVVRGVRFRPGEGEVITAAVAGKATGPGAAGHQQNPGGMATPPGIHPMHHATAPTTAEGGAEEPAGSPYLLIEVRGIIYIYNPPNLNQLGTGSTGGEPGAAPAGSPAAPAGTSPPGTAAGPPAGPPARGGQP